MDLKCIVAYSSVAHMGLVTLILFSHTVQGLVAAVFFMLAQGLVNSALFIAVTFEINNRGSNLLRHRVLRACSNRGSVICIRGARRSR